MSGDDEIVRERNRIRSVYLRRDAPGPDPRDDFFRMRRAQTMRRLLGDRIRGRGIIVDIGCGRGDQLAVLYAGGVASDRLLGIDLVHRRLTVAAGRSGAARFLAACASELPIASSSVDGALLSLVLSSIRDARMRRRAVEEAWRIVRPGGFLLVHDLRLGRPGGDARRAAPSRVRSALDPPPATEEIETLLAIPPLTRILGRWMPRVIHLLEGKSFLHGTWMARYDKECR